MGVHFLIIDRCLRESSSECKDDWEEWLAEDIISEALELMTAEVVGERMFGW